MGANSLDIAPRAENCTNCLLNKLTRSFNFFVHTFYGSMG